MKKIVKIVIIIAVIALIVVAAVKTIKAKKAKAAQIPAAKIYPIVAKTFTPALSDVTLTLPYLATVGNDADILVSSKIAARVEMIKKSGKTVKKGDLVAMLDTTDIKAAIQSVRGDIRAAKISLQNLLQTHKRTKELLAVQGASIEQYQKEQSMIASAKAGLDTLRHKLQSLQNNLSYAQIKAPVDGVVSKTFVSEGATAMPGRALLQINARGKANYLLVRTPGNISVKGVRFGSKIYPAHSLGSTYHGLQEYKVYVDADDLISGDRVEVSVVLYRGKGIRLAFDTLLDRDGKSYVLKAEGDHAVPQEVHILQSGEEGVVVKENLAGEKLVLAKPDILLRLVSGYALKTEE